MAFVVKMVKDRMKSFGEVSHYCCFTFIIRAITKQPLTDDKIDHDPFTNGKQQSVKFGNCK